MKQIISVLIALQCILIQVNCLQTLLTLYNTVQSSRGYIGTTINHLEIPEETAFASLKLERIPSLYRDIFIDCGLQNISLALKHGSLPLIVTPQTSFPPNFKHIRRSKQYHTTLLSEKNVTFINLTWPKPGCYFLTFSVENYIRACAHLRITLQVKEWSFAEINEKIRYRIALPPFHRVYLKFFTPPGVRYAIVTIANLKAPWIIRTKPKTPPPTSCVKNLHNSFKKPKNSTFSVPLSVAENNWNFIDFVVAKPATIRFKLKYSIPDSTTEFFDDGSISHVIPYRELQLDRQPQGKLLKVSYHLHAGNTINLTNNEVVALMFEVQKHVDIGSTLRFSISSKDIIVSCLHLGIPGLPTRLKCHHDGITEDAHLTLNKNVTKKWITVPYPEGGKWYATFRVFCGKCSACTRKCPNQCQENFETCINDCTIKCVDEGGCNLCSVECKRTVMKEKVCQSCNCDDGCLNSQENCTANVSFRIASTACTDDCGNNGTCKIMTADRVTFGTCKCYRTQGWNCWNSLEFSTNTSISEILLLVFSNILFLPAVYVAYKRHYYVEAVVYFFVFISSTFYHACDADTIYPMINYCITTLNALQFADFYSAALAIWTTLIAIADLPRFYSTISYVVGSLLFSFLLVIDITAVWANAVPPTAGAAVVVASWITKWRIMGWGFVERKYVLLYVPLGLVTVSLGLLFFAILVTKKNYIYFHSLWHGIMAMTIVLVLPKRGTFKKEVKDIEITRVSLSTN